YGSIPQLRPEEAVTTNRSRLLISHIFRSHARRYRRVNEVRLVELVTFMPAPRVILWDDDRFVNLTDWPECWLSFHSSTTGLISATALLAHIRASSSFVTAVDLARPSGQMRSTI